MSVTVVVNETYSTEAMWLCQRTSEILYQRRTSRSEDTTDVKERISEFAIISSSQVFAYQTIRYANEGTKLYFVSMVTACKGSA